MAAPRSSFGTRERYKVPVEAGSQTSVSLLQTSADDSPAALFSHSMMFVQQGGPHVEPPPQQLARNHYSENTWFRLVRPIEHGK